MNSEGFSKKRSSDLCLTCLWRWSWERGESLCRQGPIALEHMEDDREWTLLGSEGSGE